MLEIVAIGHTREHSSDPDTNDCSNDSTGVILPKLRTQEVDVTHRQHMQFVALALLTLSLLGCSAEPLPLGPSPTPNPNPVQTPRLATFEAKAVTAAGPCISGATLEIVGGEGPGQ